MAVIRGQRQIPSPEAGKPPLLANVFHALRSANTSLMPMFPYTEAEDMVPCATIFWGGENRDTGVFNHMNSVDEVAICFGAQKARMPTGFVHVGTRTHLVGRFLQDPTDPEECMAIVVTQLQAPEGVPQEESYTFVCETCQAPLLTHEFSARPEDHEEHGPGYRPPLETILEGARCVNPFNASEAARTCAKCGTVNEPFPVSVWGWNSYERNTVAAERARRALALTADAATK